MLKRAKYCSETPARSNLTMEAPWIFVMNEVPTKEFPALSTHFSQTEAKQQQQKNKRKTNLPYEKNSTFFPLFQFFFCLLETSRWKQAIRKAQTLLHSMGHRQSLCVYSATKKNCTKKEKQFSLFHLFYDFHALYINKLIVWYMKASIVHDGIRRYM